MKIRSHLLRSVGSDAGDVSGSCLSFWIWKWGYLQRAKEIRTEINRVVCSFSPLSHCEFYPSLCTDCIVVVLDCVRGEGGLLVCDAIFEGEF